MKMFFYKLFSFSDGCLMCLGLCIIKQVGNKSQKRETWQLVKDRVQQKSRQMRNWYCYGGFLCGVNLKRKEICKVQLLQVA